VHVGLNLVYLTPGEMGGLEVYAYELTRALAQRDDVRLTLFLGRQAADPSWSQFGETVVIPVNARRRVDWVRGEQIHLPRAVRRARPDVIHSLASTAPVIGSARRVVTVHDLNYRAVDDAHPGIRGLGMRVLVPLAVRRAHRVICDSASTRDDVVRWLRAPPERIDVVPLGTGQRDPDARPDAERALRRLQLDGRPLLLTVSAKRPHKNLLRLIGALAQIPPAERPVLALPGFPTAHERELRERADTLGVTGDVRFLGWVSSAELEDLYAAASWFVFPSLYEGFGLPVLEAMQRGVPVATSSRGSLAEVAGDAAVMFDPESESDIAAAIRRLVADRELAERMRRAGREQAARFTWERTAEETVRSYRRALQAE
jgi:glycosyltransferase involved in cell wall biosynthesis